MMNTRQAKRRRLENNANNEHIEVIAPISPSRNVAGAGELQEVDQPDAGQSHDQQLPDEPKQEEIKITCRLRHGLNDDCLCEIFRYLGVFDLIQLCELDVYYQNLITKWVISKKLINFTKMDPCWTTNKIFQVFGKSMRKIKIAEENTLGCFERFLIFVIQHCSEGALKEVELRFSSPTAAATVMQQSMPYFSNLRKLVLNDNYTRVSYKEFLAGIAATATNLTHLTLEGVNVSGGWLQGPGMDNLRELRLHTSKRRSMSIETGELSEFLRTKPKLEIFSYIGSDDISPVAETLTQCCPNLKVFADFHLSNPYRGLAVISDQMKYRYNFVRFFENVKTLGVTSYTQCGSDIYYPLVKLAAQNKVESLKIFLDRDTGISLPENLQSHHSSHAFAHFTKLNSVELQIKSDASEQCTLNTDFITEFIANQATVKKFCLISEHAIRDINKVIDLAPNLNELNVSQTKMKYLPVEMCKIVKSIRKRRQNLIESGITEPARFHLVVNEQQWREVRVNKDVDIILTTTMIESVAGCTLFKVSGP